jgi:hypothetical protein
MISNWTDAKDRLGVDRRAPDPELQRLRNEVADREAMLRHVMTTLRSLLSALESVVTR